MLVKTHLLSLQQKSSQGSSVVTKETKTGCLKITLLSLKFH